MLNRKQRADFEARLRKAFLAESRAHADELIRLLGNPPEVGRVPAAFWQKLDTDLAAALEPIIVEMAVTSAAALGEAAAVSSSVNWTLVNTRAETWAARYTFHLVTGINRNTQRTLQREIANFFRDAGKDLKGLAGDIQPDIPALVDKLGRVISSETRAEMIATTEATRAAAQGEQALVAEIRAANPRVQVVEIWLASQDELLCELCGPLHGKRRGAEWSEPPPAHPRCRCTSSIEFVGLERDA